MGLGVWREKKRARPFAKSKDSEKKGWTLD
jgi:hypothetical protein